jgi:hypothetical protein
VLGGQPSVEVGTQRTGHLIGEEVPQAATRDPADNLAHENP